MSDIVVLAPDIELLVVQFLLVQDEFSDLGPKRIVTELPKEKVFPLVRLHQFNDQQITAPPLWLMRYSLQVDVWGGTKNACRSLAETMRAVLVARLPDVHAAGVVTGCQVGGLDTTVDNSVPTDKGNARPRCRFDTEIWAHPLPAVSS